MNKLADHLNTKKQANFEDDNRDEKAPVSFQFRRNFLDDGDDHKRRASQPDDPTVDFRYVSRYPLDTVKNSGSLPLLSVPHFLHVFFFFAIILCIYWLARCT